MMQDAKAFWDAMRSHVARLCRQETANALRAERYDVTTAPDGKVIGVRQPFGAQEIKIPYAAEVASAAVGDTGLGVWWGAMSNAKAWFFGSGPA